MSRIDLSKIKLSQLRAFAAVAKHHNFSGAAAHLDRRELTTARTFLNRAYRNQKF